MICRRLAFAGLLWLHSFTWAAEPIPQVERPFDKTLDFGVFWPPKDTSPDSALGTNALLKGRVLLRLEDTRNSEPVLRLRITLTRPSDEAARASWNQRLAFPEYDWMRYVRVWDADRQWLWPNLPYLLRLPGTERVERYGGVDPGKGVDNDFAAVLIRKFDPTGERESQATKSAPLVSAEWSPPLAMAVDKQAIVHTAQSDEFSLHLGRDRQPRAGRAKVWLIYADFMGATLPQSWPREPEFAGGILAYFELDWDLNAPGRPAVSVRQRVPGRSTGFDWERWASRTRAAFDPKRTAKLSDLPAASTPVTPPGRLSGRADRQFIVLAWRTRKGFHPRNTRHSP